MPALVAFLAVLVTSALAATAEPAFAAGAISVDGGEGTLVRVETSPFEVTLIDRDGHETLATVPGPAAVPVRPPGVDGPQPSEPLGAVGGFPAIGWVTGARAGSTMPLGLFAGNRLLGAEAGAIVSVTGVRSATRSAEGGARLALDTDAPGAGPATLALDRLARRHAKYNNI